MKALKDMKFFGKYVACIGIGLVVGMSSGCRSSKPAQDERGENKSWNSATASRDLYVRSNEVRLRKGLNALEWNGELAELARDHAQKMATKDRLSHDGFKHRFAVLRAAGIAIKLTENVAMSKGFADPVGTTIRGWIDSPGHRRNLYDRDVAFTGVGFAVSRSGRIYCAQLYGK